MMQTALGTGRDDRSLAFIMPCFNTPSRYIEQAVETINREKPLICKQGFSVSLLMVDDASTLDETINTIEALVNTFDWIDVLRLPVNLGPAGSRNQAIKQSDSEWIAFLDSDDYLLEGGIAHLCSILNTDTSIAWISGDFYLNNNDEENDNRGFYPNHPERFKYVREAYLSNLPIKLNRPIIEFLDGSLCSMGSCIISKRLLERVGLFNSQQRKGVDTELYWRLARDSDMVFVPMPIFVYRRHANSVSSNGQQISDWEPPVLKRMLSDQKWLQYREGIKKRLIRSLLNLAFAAGRQGNSRLALRLTTQAVGLKPYGWLPWRAFFTQCAFFLRRFFS